MNKMNSARKQFLVWGFLGLIFSSEMALAQTATDANAKVRCSDRINAALTNRMPKASTSTDPKAQVSTLLQSADFVENFSKFINSSFNDDPGQTPGDDAPYHLAKYILENKKPWAELFTGAYDFQITGTGAKEVVSVVDNSNGLGYFRTSNWSIRYAGNEEAGVRIVTAYRMMNNITGLKLTATTNAPGADISAKGREAPACRACHYDSWSALDKVAAALGKTVNKNNKITFTPPDGQAHEMLGGLQIKDDKELVEALVGSENFSFNSCRLVFSFLYGRSENMCEGKVFDACVTAFKKTGMIQDAISAVIGDANFCQ